MAILGWILIVIGVSMLVVGLVEGAKAAFKAESEPGTRAVLPSAFLEVLKELLAAPPAKFFTITGFILVVLGLVLNGVEVFSSQ